MAEALKGLPPARHLSLTTLTSPRSAVYLACDTLKNPGDPPVPGMDSLHLPADCSRTLLLSNVLPLKWDLYLGSRRRFQILILFTHRQRRGLGYDSSTETPGNPQ